MALSLEGRAVAGDGLDQQLSWAMDVGGGRPTSKSLLARTCRLWVVLPGVGPIQAAARPELGIGEARKAFRCALWKGTSPGVDFAQSYLWTPCLREETAVGPLSATETGASWAQDRKCPTSIQDFVCAHPQQFRRLFKGQTACLTYTTQLIQT